MSVYVDGGTWLAPVFVVQPFERLTSNVKGPIDIELAPVTCIVGANKVGKSSILDTIRLALTGKHPVGPHPANLAELAPEGSTRLYAELHGSAGSLVWDMAITDGRPRKSVGVIGHGEFARMSAAARQSMIVLDHASFMGFGPERMRRVVMERFGDIEAVQPPPGLNADQVSMWQAAQIAAKGDASEQLTSMQKWLKSTAKTKGDEATQKERTIAALRAHTADVGGADVLAMVETQLTQAVAWDAAERDRAEHARLSNALVDVNAQLTELEAVDTSADRAQLKDLLLEKADAERALTNARNLAILIERADGSTCPCCGTEDVNLGVLRTEIQKGTAVREQQLVEVTRDIADIESRLPDAQVAQLRIQQTELTQQLKGVTVGLPEPYQGPSAEELRNQINIIREALANHKRIARETEEMHQLLDEQATAKLLERQVTSMLNSYIQTVRERAQDTVNRYMPEGFRAELRVTDTVCEWRMFGDDGRSHKSGAYSGSEGGNLLIALAQAWGADAPLRIVLLDDVDLGVFDRDQLASVFAKFKESVDAGLIDQVILVWNRPDEVPADWHTVTLRRPTHS